MSSRTAVPLSERSARMPSSIGLRSPRGLDGARSRPATASSGVESKSHRGLRGAGLRASGGGSVFWWYWPRAGCSA